MRPDHEERVGRARVLRTQEIETWEFEEGDRAMVERIAGWGAHGLSGYERATGGALAIFRGPMRSVQAFGRGERIDPARALLVVRRLASALATAEQEALAVGRLGPANIAFDSSGAAHVLIDRVIRTLVGECVDHTPDGDSTAVKWIPPEQAQGAPWTSSANRYVVGLVLYRLISGAHPFGGAGLRHAVEASTSAPSAPPFDKRTSADLPPGLQSLVLRMISAAEGDRPSSAAEIVSECDHIAERTMREPLTNPSPVRTLWRGMAQPHVPLAARGWLVASAAGAIAIAVSASGSAGKEGSRASDVHAVTPLARADSTACASCHVEEYRQWKDSVMAHATESPLFGALESAIEEQVGKSDACPTGAGVLREGSGAVCREPRSGVALTGAGGEGWCVNCHAPGVHIDGESVVWDPSRPATQRPLRDLLSREAMHGVSCVACHTTAHAAARGDRYAGNRTWRSPLTGVEFLSRPEERRGETGIANSGYSIDRTILLGSSREGVGEPMVHRRPPEETRAYLSSSEFCGACHDVRLFGTDTLGAANGEHFKRLRNAYSEWRSWSENEARNGRTAATCQGCHMSLYPGVCVPGRGAQNGCPSGTHFESRAPGIRGVSGRSSHYFTSVDIPLSATFSDAAADSTMLDADGVPVGLRARRAMLLKSALRFDLLPATHEGRSLRIPIEIENIGAGHRVPAGFSQEREIWVELIVTDANGNIVYEAGTIGRDDEDLHDKIFLRTTTKEADVDRAGEPLGMFGADVADGPDVPRWKGGLQKEGRGLINLQNGFLRCVRCVGAIDAKGECQPITQAQRATRAARFEDGDYDIDSGECKTNLSGEHALFETYFPIGALDASRGRVRGPDAIIDTRSAAPGEVIRYVTVVPIAEARPPFRVHARLRFRAFPPFLIRAFADYEREQTARGLRPSGAQVTESMLSRIDVVDLAEVEREER